MAKKKTVSIEISPHSGAIIFKPDGLEFMIPDVDDDEEMPDHIILCAGLAMRLRDDAVWSGEIMNWIRKKIGDIKEVTEPDKKTVH